MIYSLILNLDWEKGWTECEIIKLEEWLTKSLLLVLADLFFFFKEEVLPILLVSPLEGKQAFE